MDNTQILSPQPSIDEALEFLRMSQMDKAMGINTLLRTCEGDDLPLFFDEKLFCVPTSIKYGDQYDEEGEFLETFLIDREDEREFWSEHILDNFQLHMPSSHLTPSAMIQWTKAKDLATLVVRVTAFLLWLLLCVAFSKSDCQNALYNPDRPDDDSTPEDVTVPRTRRQLEKMPRVQSQSLSVRPSALQSPWYMSISRCFSF